MYIGAVAVLPTYALSSPSGDMTAVDSLRRLSRLLQESKGVKQALREVCGPSRASSGTVHP